ncbi:MAG: class I SAM-dependent methyltransferase [Actinobacteria bacterium]|nr:class I SAM-dependent methyltransferase [Actinomycetota bacterium]
MNSSDDRSVLAKNQCVTTGSDRSRLGATFDQAAELYQRARPDYPNEVYDRLLHVTQLPDGARLLEVGCATGKATVPLASRGFWITCLEPGRSLAAAARKNLSAFHVEVLQTTFEDWEPSGPSRFAMVYAATAWHWVDPNVRYLKAAEVLEPGGYLALWNAGHVFPRDGDPIFVELQRVYDEIGEGMPPDTAWPRPQELPDDRDEIEASGQFDVADITQFDWEVTYDAETYIELLDTFSGHIAMAQWQRDRLYGEIRRRLAEREDGRLRRHWGAVLQIARRRSA